MEWQYFKHELPGTESITNDEESECYSEFVSGFVEENGYLPIECRDCYKALIFWPYSNVNVSNFERMLESLPVSIHGKYNNRVVVFYFKAKERMLAFLDILKEKMDQFGVKGKIDWRVSGRYWQDNYPQFFQSDKEFKPIRWEKDISMKEWLKRNSMAWGKTQPPSPTPSLPTNPGFSPHHWPPK